MKLFAALLMLAFVMPSNGLMAQETKNNLTHGTVQMNLKVNETTQLQVVEAFGAPNITTIDGSGQEVWIYNRHATVSESKEKGFSIGMLFGGVGGAVGGGAGGGFNSSKSGFEESTRQMTLIIKFGSNKVVSDFKSRSSSF
jgi:hypothetical protein